MLLPFAAAIEMIHTYSLIHDDLPAMDDDALRRGKPTCHVAFGEDVAILAGDGLFAEALRLALTEQAGEPADVLAGVRELTAAAGVGGMVGGQFLDVTAEADLNVAGLRRLHELKTGRLIAASVSGVVHVCGASGPATIGLGHFAAELGVLFQIVDDILDVTGDDAELGKPSGSDERHGKQTYVSAFGLDRAKELAGESHAEARAALARVGGRTERLESDRRLHPDQAKMTRLLDGIDGPEDLKPLDEQELAQVAQEVREEIIDTIGEIGGHFGANLGACEIAVAIHSLLDSPRDKVLWDVGHQAYPAQGPDRQARAAGHHPQVQGPRAVLLGVRVRARHHGRRPRLHLGVLCGGAEGGHAPRHRRGRPGGRGDRRRCADRRRRVRGAAQRRRVGPADRDRGERQRHVDRPQRRRPVALLPPHPDEPQAAPRARGGRGQPHQAPRRHRPPDRAPGADREGVAQGLLGAGALLRGAGHRLHRRDRRPRRRGAARGDRRGARGRSPGGRPRPHGQGQGLRPGRGRRPGGHGEVARRQARLDRERRARRPSPSRRRTPTRRPRSTRRCSATRSWRRRGATSA